MAFIKMDPKFFHFGVVTLQFLFLKAWVKKWSSHMSVQVAENPLKALQSALLDFSLLSVFQNDGGVCGVVIM